MITSCNLVYSAPCPPDPLDDVPSADSLRAVIREYVCRTEVLRQLLRVALRRERLGLVLDAPRTREEVRS